MSLRSLSQQPQNLGTFVVFLAHLLCFVYRVQPAQVSKKKHFLKKLLVLLLKYTFKPIIFLN